MASEYDIFERTPAGYLVWRDVVAGYEDATRRLGELASQSPNEHFLFNLTSKQVIARVNEPVDQTDSHLSSNATADPDIWKMLRPLRRET